MTLEIDLECGETKFEDATFLAGFNGETPADSNPSSNGRTSPPFEKSSDLEESHESANITGDSIPPKKKRTRKASKPPRPPKGPLLDAVDQKIMREIAAVADRKRARIERIKTLKKMRTSKTYACNNTLVALIITVVFCAVLILQAFYSRNSGIVTPRISLEPAVAGGGLVSVLNQSYSKGLVDQ